MGTLCRLNDGMADPYAVALGSGVLVSFFFSAFFSMSETALLTIKRTRLRFLADNGNARAQLALSLLHQPKRLLATILIGNNVANVIASVFTTALALQYWGDWGLGLATGVLTFALLLFGEVTPKTFANEHAEWVSLHAARPLRVFVAIFRPVEGGLNAMARVTLRALGGRRLKPAQFHTEEEIKVLLRMGRERGHISAREAKLIRAVFEFNDLEIVDIMQPANSVASLRADQPLAEVLQLVARTGHSRYPVLDESGTAPIGLVYAKDLLMMSHEQVKNFRVNTILRGIPRFAPNYRVTSALDRLQREGSHMAAVVEESGTFLGILTLEDLIEEIVGEIEDEYEVAQRRLQDGRAQARTEQDDVVTHSSPAAGASPPRGGTP